MGMGTNLLLLIFCLSFFLYLGGYKSGFLMMTTCWSGGVYDVATDTCTPIGIVGGLGSSDLISSLIISLVAGFTGAVLTGVLSRAVAGSYSVFFTIPAAFITTFMAAFVLLPISFLFEPTMPPVLQMFLGGFLYIALIAIIISFIRGGEF